MTFFPFCISPVQKGRDISDILLIVKKKKRNRKKQLRLITILACIVFLALIYLIGVVHYGRHFLPNTYVAQIDVGGLNAKKADEKLKESEPYLNIIQKNKDGSDTVVEQLGLRKLNADIAYETDDLIRKQDRTLWFTSLFSKKELDCDKITGTYDQNKVRDLIKDLYCMKNDNIVMPKDATLAIENATVVLQKEVEGSYIKEEKVNSLVKEKIERLFEGNGDVTLDLTNEYDLPTIKADDPSLQEKMVQDQKVLDETIHIDIDSYNETDLKGSDRASLLQIDNGQLKINEDGLSDYISSFCREYDVSDSEYIDRSSLKNDLHDALLSDKEETVEVNWIIEEREKLVEVSISEQTLYYYEGDTLIMTSPVVTGNGDITDATPTGYFTVQRMKQDSWLTGADYTEHVDYWIGFDPSGRVYGLHDASWRNEFGGDIYLSDPSRGCVNMPVEKISQLWDYIDIGTEIYIHE